MFYTSGFYMKRKAHSLPHTFLYMSAIVVAKSTNIFDKNLISHISYFER